MRQDVCRSCNAPVVWVQTVKGKRMPVDLEPVWAGNLILRERMGQAPLVFYTKPYAEIKRFISHFSTCPEAKRWRGKVHHNEKT
jgi:hypothetical protein